MDTLTGELEEFAFDGVGTFYLPVTVMPTPTLWTTLTSQRYTSQPRTSKP